MSVVIVGGGIVGTTLALAISKLTNGQLPVYLIEAISPQDVIHPDFNIHTIAIAQGTYQHLAHIGIWQEIADCAMPIKTIHINESRHSGLLILDALDYHINAFGYVVKLHEVKLRLFKLLQNSQGVVLYCPAKVISITRNEFNINVKLDSEIILEAQLLIAADGYNSMIASQCGIKLAQKSYNQIAIITSIKTTAKHNDCAWECFTKYGPLAILPMLYGHKAIIWCHSLEKRKEILSWSDEYFCKELQKAFNWRLGNIDCVNHRSAYSLNLSIAAQSVTHRLALIGDASQTLHPIAGQGCNLGLRDAISLAEVLTKAWFNQQDYGAYRVLHCYQQRRQLDKAMTIKMTDNLVNIFSNHWTPLVIGRKLGLMVLELCIPIRDILVHRALGWVDY